MYNEMHGLLGMQVVEAEVRDMHVVCKCVCGVCMHCALHVHFDQYDVCMSECTVHSVHVLCVFLSALRV
jgi:hypothetical protein